MNRKKSKKKIYMPPKIELIQVEMESCLATGPIVISPVNVYEITDLVEKSKVIS